MTQQQQQQQQQQQHQQALHLPLLGDEPQCYDDELNNNEPESSSEKAVESNDKEDVQHQFFDAIFFSIAMPTFLFLQFAFAFSRQHDGDDNEKTTMTTTTIMMSWSTVNWNIGLFAVTVWLYRWACMDSRRIITNSLLLLLPEIMTNVVLVILVFDDKIATAFVALLVGIQLMSFIALAVTVQCLYNSSNSGTKNNVEGQEDEAQKQVDILIV